MVSNSGNEGEFSFIRWIKSQLPADLKKTEMGVGDDAAVLAVGERRIAVTTDIIVEGVDFSLDEASARQIGRKALAVSLSDIAAMGLEANWALLAVNLREDLSMQFAKEVFLGALELARTYSVEICGGDTSSSPDSTCLTSTVIACVETLEPVYRSGARVGDFILVTGELGGSILGKHLDFTPRLREALLLNRDYRINAMMDISDGLSIDLSHLLQASGCGAVIEEDAIPISPAALSSARKRGCSPLECALADGEDFELLFTLDPAEGKRLLKNPPFETRLTHIGRIVERGFQIRSRDGALSPIEPRGYEHFKKT